MSKQTKEGIEIEPSAKEQLMIYPLEQLMPVSKNFQKLSIGIPKEINKFERRIALSPDSVEILTRNGHQVMVEAGAGLESKFEDREFSEAGAQVVYTAKEVYQSNIVLKIEPPTETEISFMKPGSTLISAIQITKLSQDYIRTLLKKKIIAVAFEFIEDATSNMPVVRAMSEIAGSTVMLIAGEYLSSERGGRGIIVGGITGVPPTKVVIIGAGTIGEYAARTALGLGAEVKIFDKNLYRLRRIKYAVGHHVYTSIIDASKLAEAVGRADVIVGAARPESGRTPILVTEEMVSKMKPNSVIIDVSIDYGGCIETSEVTTLQNPVFKKYDVIHYCVPNIASRVAHTSSTALSNIFTPYLLEIGERGGIEDMTFYNKWFTKGIYIYKGVLTNPDLAQKFEMNYKDIGLLMAARF